jgi:hypothetical protein
MTNDAGNRLAKALCCECLIDGIVAAAPQHKESQGDKEERRDYLCDLNHLRGSAHRAVWLWNRTVAKASKGSVLDDNLGPQALVSLLNVLYICFSLR